MTESGEKFKMSQAAEQVLKNGAILAPSKEHKSTIIFLHGLGDSGHSWAFGLKGMRVALPNTKIVCPTAPQAKVTLNNGHASTSWHDLGSLSEIDSEEKNTYAGVDENLKIVQEIIEKEIDSGIPSEKIVIAGFSQGAAMSILTGFTFEKKLAGIAALSGYLVKRSLLEKSITDVNKNTETVVFHGTADGVVPFSAGKKAFELLKKLGADQITFESFEGMAHSSCDKEMNLLRKFFEKVLNDEEEEKK